MKKIISVFFVLCFILSFSQVKENLVIPKNPKIGLSLAGGGAKGFAHVGVLKILDSLGVKVDYISGTSMGAIVGFFGITKFSLTREKLNMKQSTKKTEIIFFILWN
jgi:predicted acylesterase/phospholipase RssA